MMSELLSFLQALHALNLLEIVNLSHDFLEISRANIWWEEHDAQRWLALWRLAIIQAGRSDHSIVYKILTLYIAIGEVCRSCREWKRYIRASSCLIDLISSTNLDTIFKIPKLWLRLILSQLAHLVCFEMHVLAVIPPVRDLLDCSLGCSSKILFIVFTDHMLSLGLVIFIDLLLRLIEGLILQGILRVVLGALGHCIRNYRLNPTPVHLHSFDRRWPVAFDAWRGQLDVLRSFTLASLGDCRLRRRTQSRAQGQLELVQVSAMSFIIMVK